MTVLERKALKHWSAAGAEPGLVDGPAGLRAAGLRWRPAGVPGTVGQVFGDRSAAEIDALDWWYRCEFEDGGPCGDGERLSLHFEGLATIADAWLNGVHVLSSRSMFRPHEVDVTNAVRTTNELVVRFAPLRPVLDEYRRPRPRWTSRLVEQRGLRYVRTSLFGRMPGWSPGPPPVGPWRAVVLERWRSPRLRDARVATDVDANAAEVSVRLRFDRSPPGCGVVTLCGTEAALRRTGPATLEATIELSDPALWWPHTHGGQPLQPLDATFADGTCAPLGRVGLRSVVADVVSGGLRLLINGEPVFCRGACWAPLDPAALHGSQAAYREALEAARDAGMNMIRVPGTGIYESDVFFDLCDELGLLVWQDFMFARLDYPVDDPAFRADVEAEVRAELARRRTNPSLAVACGGSEVAQQAAMSGLPPESWDQPLTGELLPALCREARPDVPFWPDTPHGGRLPFECDAGTTHYFGVGAYMRDLGDIRRSDVRFATECLAIAQVCEPRPGEDTAEIYGPRWKSATPRDSGAGWDFDDVRDHYLRELYGVDPLQCRYEDPRRYLELSRTVAGELMTEAFSEWRRPGARCAGALIWLYQDIAAGAGWGIRDASARPKAAYYFLQRALSPVAVLLTDEGLNGVDAHVFNETAEELRLDLGLELLRFDADRSETTSLPVVLAPREQRTISLATAFGGFRDLSHAYRFAPCGHDVLRAALHSRSGALVSEAWHFPAQQLAPVRSIGLHAQPACGSTVLEVSSRYFAQAVTVRSDAFVTDDNVFHLSPGTVRRLRLSRVDQARGGVITVSAQNARAVERVRID